MQRFLKDDNGDGRDVDDEDNGDDDDDQKRQGPCNAS